MQSQLAAPPQEIVGCPAPFLFDEICDFAVGEAATIVPPALIEARSAVENIGRPRTIATDETFGPWLLKEGEAGA